MRKCPKCGLPTARTEDWACRWCGYPLLSKTYKKVSKTYQQLKQERQHQPEHPASEETEVLRSTDNKDLPLIPELDMGTEPNAGSKIELISTTAERTEIPLLPSHGGLLPIHTPAPEPKLTLESAQELTPVTSGEIGLSPLASSDNLPATLSLEPEPELAKEAEPELAATAIELTVEELSLAYETDEAAANAKFRDRMLKVTGVVGIIGIKDVANTPFILLTSTGQNDFSIVRCLFTRESEAELARLSIGQLVTVQGKCDNYLINVYMTDCVVVH